jgi:hypothetical protein
VAYVPPTVDDFRRRFPGFSGFPDETVQMVLDEAILEVTEGWVDRDRFNATLYLTAHLLWTQQLGVIDPSANGDGSGSGSISTVTGGELKRRKVGDVEVEWATSSTAASTGGASHGGGSVTAAYWESIYGRRYLELMRRSFPAVRVV